MSAHFSLPLVEDSDGWGPTGLPEKFKEVPYYAPFNKGDKVGKAADWQQQQHQGRGRYQKQQQQQQEGVTTIFQWQYQDDDSTFQIVDSTKNQLKKVGGRKYQNKFQQRQQRGHTNFQLQQQQLKQNTRPGQQKRQQQLGMKFQQRKWGTFDVNAPGNKKREASVAVKEDWNLLETFEFNSLNKTSVDAEPKSEDISTYGSTEFYDKNFDRLTSKLEKPLERTSKIFFNVTTTDDPVIKQLAMEESGNVFATDTILSHLMTAPRSLYPWDIIVTKVGTKLFFDKRDGSQFDSTTVNETSPEPPIEDGKEGINSASSLSREATFVNQSFSQQILSKEGGSHKFAKPNPFQSEGEVSAAVAYKYRRFDMGDDIKLVARCEVDGAAAGKNKDLLLSIKALNEFDLKTTDWRKKIDTQRGAVFATELKNNANKLAKWAAQSILAGNDGIKLGFVSRASAKDNYNHVILAIQDYTPREFATQINLNPKNSWGVLKRIIDACMKQPTGKYVIMKDPEKPNIKLYAVPEATFQKQEKSTA